MYDRVPLKNDFEIYLIQNFQRFHTVIFYSTRLYDLLCQMLFRSRITPITISQASRDYLLHLHM